MTLENWRHGVFVLGPADVRSSTVVGNGWGVTGGPVRVTDCTLTGNHALGAFAYEGTKDGIHYKFHSLKVRRSTFAGNAVDLGAYKRPVVRDTACTTSDHLTIPSAPFGGGDEWNVCP